MQIHKHNCTVDIDNKLIFLTGDALSVSNLDGFIKSLQHERSHVFEKTHEKGSMLRKALSKVAPVIVDWNIRMNMLVNM